jgi:hypothetical protein
MNQDEKRLYETEIMSLKKGFLDSKLAGILENRAKTPYQTTTSVLKFLNSIEKDVVVSIEYLQSEVAAESLKLDPYWPKWNSPWWHMTVLYELGLSERIPYIALELFQKALEEYLHFFPFTEAEVPAGRDPISDVLCMCALATADRILRTSGVVIDASLPWMREWFVRYQLSDGGYNCDEAVYAKNGKSSMISTIHMMESLLDILASTGLSENETECLDKSAKYVIDRKLMRSISKNQIIDPAWILLTFPRFYEIDILRVLRCIVRWSLLRNKPLPWIAIEEVVCLIDEKMQNQQSVEMKKFHGLDVEREFYSSCTTRIPARDGTWKSKQPVTAFPALIAIGEEGRSAPMLTESWLETLDNLQTALDRDLLLFE